MGESLDEKKKNAKRINIGWKHLIKAVYRYYPCSFAKKNIYSLNALNFYNIQFKYVLLILGSKHNLPIYLHLTIKVSDFELQ